MERCEAPILRQRIDAAIAELEPRAALLARFRTLGAAAPRQRGTLPPLCELLFPEADVRAVAAEMGAEVGDAVAWDAPTFVAWLKGEGFEVSGERRVPREPGELEGLDRFADKLRWLDPRELRTAALEVELRPPPSASAHRATPGPLLEFDEDEPTRTALLHAHVDPAQLPAAAAELYESTRPGHELRLELPDEPAPASRTTILLALMRVGFEILSEDGSGYRITRPLELSDLRRFAGLE